ncbi:hypothetical protein AK812_SmicGene20025 [Symbiodinium microadriaticum]|uniref:RING-type domain-containing protein n=1 Tax=Symbiodinium microadriaticum TaxID=2951 RepID=A0A1Q9DR29_SYMMI|nr:hypothetical protein AK812_SmicGene20025 [Symbiodinium microadriaticum]CAE7232594.1 unnamed protein product [Symbiodinium sp. KB8]
MSRAWWILPLIAAALGQPRDCRHGKYDNTTQKCICDKHWATAGITDTVDFLEGVCEQFRCESDKQCREFLGDFASCPVPNWNCYCGWGKSYENGYRGFENERAECMGLMYTFSVWTTETLWYVFQIAWKVFPLLSIFFIVFGRKRVRCDHHDTSLWNDVLWMCGCPSDCEGGCPMAPEPMDVFFDEFAWSIYILSLGVWFQVALTVVYLLAFFVWSVLLWAMVMIMLVVAAIAGLCVLCGCAGGGEGSVDCCDAGCCDFSSCGSCGPADCCCCFGDGAIGASPTDGLMYWSGPYPGPYDGGSCDCCYPVSSTQHGRGSCCFIFAAPFAWLVRRFPRMPDNAWGGLLGRWLGTHRQTSPEQLYQGGSRIIDFFSLQWMRREGDLHHDTNWRNQVAEFVLNQNQAVTRYADTDHSGDGSELEHAPLTRGRRPQYVGLATCIHLNGHFHPERDGCVPSSWEDYEKNVCWICQDGNAEWDLWLSCGHMFCKRCSETMLRRRMPCPLCRRASTVVQRGFKHEVASRGA